MVLEVREGRLGYEVVWMVLAVVYVVCAWAYLCCSIKMPVGMVVESVLWVHVKVLVI